MKYADTINAKEIRQDLEGFLKRVKSGKPLTVIYRSKPYVTINAPTATHGAIVPGSPQAIKRGLSTARLLRQSTQAKANTSYHELLEKKYGSS